MKRTLTYLISGLAVAGLLLLLLFLYVKFQERWGIFHPYDYNREWFERVPENFPGCEPVEFETEDGVTLTGVWKSGQPGAPAIILFQGNGGNITGRTWWLDLVPPEDWSALIFDYRGFGLSGGSPSEQGLYRDVEAAVDFVGARVDAPLFYHGRSLGSVMASRAAGYRPPAGLIIDSGFADAASMAKTILPVPGIGLLLSVELDALSNLRRAGSKAEDFPKLVIHGTSDQVVPYRLGKKLFEQLPPEKEIWEVEGAGHNNLVEVAGEEKYSKKVKKFLSEAVDGNL